MSAKAEAHDADLYEAAYTVGWYRAPFDKATLGHFNNKYRDGEPEHDGYKAFVSAVMPREFAA